MKINWKMTIVSALLSISVLSGCNNAGDNEMTGRDEGDVTPVRYDRDTILNDDLNDLNILYDPDMNSHDNYYDSNNHLNNGQRVQDSGNRTRGNNSFEHGEDSNRTDM